MFLRLLVESLRRSRRRKVIAASAIALGTLAATAVAALLLASGDRLAADLAVYGANIDLAPAAGELFPVAGLEKARRIFWRHNLVALAPLFAVRVDFRPGSRLGSINGAPAEVQLVAPLVGTWFDWPLEPEWRTGLPRTRPALVPDGRWPKDGAAEVTVGRRLATRLGAKTGQTLRVRLADLERELTVVGVIGGGGEEEDAAFAPLAVVAMLTGHADAVPRAEVLALTVPELDVAPKDPKRMSPAEYDAWYCTAYASAIAQQLEEAVPATRATVVRGVSGAAGELLTRLRGVLLTLAALLLGAAVLGTTAAMTATTLERRLEVGLFAALGAERLQIALFFLSEAALLGLLGGLAGGAAGLVVGRLLGRGVFGVDMPWSPVLLPFAVLAGVGVALVGSIPPVLRAVRLDAARTLKGATA